MTIAWTLREKESIWDQWRADDHLDDIVRAERLASEAVSLFLARASGEVKEDVGEIRDTLERLPQNGVDMAALSRLAALAQEAEALRASADELQRQRDRRGEALEAAEATIKDLRAKEAELEAHASRLEEVARLADAEVERLKGWREKCINDNNAWAARLTAAESRLAAIWERGQDTDELVRRWVDIDDDATGSMRLLMRWVLEGDAPNSSTTSNGSGVAPQEAKCPTHPHDSGACEPMQDEPWRCVYGEHALGGGPIKLHPCSPTCTHDDAANPGHPERVREWSAKVSAIYGPPTKDPVGELATLAGAKPGREAASYRAGYEQGCDDMRAACWAAVEPVLRANLGASPGSPVYDETRAAITGATP